MMVWEDEPETPAEVEYSRMGESRLEWRRRMEWGKSPVCSHCGYIITTVGQARIVNNWAGKRDEVRLFHDACFPSALAIMKIRACSPRRQPT